MSCGIVHRSGSDSALLRLWCRLAATALIGPLAWEPPCAVGMALKKQRQKYMGIIKNALSARLCSLKGNP